MTATFSEVMWVSTGVDVIVVLLEVMHQLLSNQSCTLDVAEVVVAAVILEDVVHMELGAVLQVADRVLLTRGLSTISTVNEVITSLRNAERSLIDLSGHS